MMNRIKALREDHDYTQQYVADCIGITQRKYSYLETGTQQLTAEILVLLANLYNVSVDYILFQTDTTRRYPKSNHATTQNIKKRAHFRCVPFLLLFSFA